MTGHEARAKQGFEKFVTGNGCEWPDGKRSTGAEPPAALLLPVADVVGALLAIRAEGPQIVAVLVVRAGLAVLVWVAPRIERGLFQVRALPATPGVTGGGQQPGQPLVRRRVRAHVQPVRHQRGRAGRIDKGLGDAFLPAAEELVQGDNARPGEHRDQGDHDQNFDQGEAAANRAGDGGDRGQRESVVGHGN